MIKSTIPLTFLPRKAKISVESDNYGKLKKHGLIVSCQAVKGEPLYGLHMMGHFARAAVLGGAAGIRANYVEDINEITAEVDVPVIGIIKAEYPDSEVYITPTLKEVRALRQRSAALLRSMQQSVCARTVRSLKIL